MVLEHAGAGSLRANQGRIHAVHLCRLAPVFPRLRKLAASHTPALNEDGELDRFILGLMNGKAALGDIAQQAVERFPNHFAQLRDAVQRVDNL